jgi:hypothetical protein
MSWGQGFSPAFRLRAAGQADRLTLESLFMGLLLLVWALLGPQRPCETTDLGQPRPELARIFTPLTAPPGVYVVMATNRPIRDVADSLAACDPSPPAGAWKVTATEAHEAFGQAGIYDRLRLAQLFGGKRLDVVRGALAHDGARDAYTLISPYPDAAMTTTNGGTLVIVVHVAPQPPAGQETPAEAHPL